MDADFRKFWWGETFSTFGTVFTVTATSVLAVDVLGASNAAIGVMSAAAYLPACVLGPWIGRMADRTRSPRRQLVRGTALAAASIIATALVTSADMLSVAWLIGLALVLGTLAVVTETLYFTHLQSLVPSGELIVARARLQGGEQGAGLVGNSVAGLAVAALGGVFAFGVDAFTYVASGALLLWIARPDIPAERPAAEPEAPRTGRRLGGLPARGTLLRGIFGLLLLQSASAGAVDALLAPYLLRVLHVPVSLFGLAFAVTGLAGLAGSWLAARVAGRGDPRFVLLASAAVQVGGGAVLAAAGGHLVPALALAALGLVLSKIAGAVANIALSGLITRETPAHLLGQTVGVLRSATTGVRVAGSLLGGVVAEAAGARAALWCVVLLPLAALVPLLWNRGRGRPSPVDSAGASDPGTVPSAKGQTA